MMKPTFWEKLCNLFLGKPEVKKNEKKQHTEEPLCPSAPHCPSTKEETPKTKHVNIQPIKKSHTNSKPLEVRKNVDERALTVPSPNYVDYENCIFCHKPVTRANAFFLTNGMKLHKDCYDICTEKQDEVQKDIIAKANAFWDGYPPDWESRKAGVLREVGYKCEICGKTNVPIQVHHKISFKDGGSNEFSNLEALCLFCHQSKHKHDIRNVDFDHTDTSVKNIVTKAIQEKKKLHIVYLDAKGNSTNRHVIPKRIYNRASRDFLIAFCLMRNAEREFKLERIKSIQIE